MLLFGQTMPAAGIRFRQDNDFYYLTGNEDLNAVLLMDLAKNESHLFVPTQGPGEIRSDGCLLHSPLGLFVSSPRALRPAASPAA